MVRNLKAADTIGKLSSKLKVYTRPHVLVLDESRLPPTRPRGGQPGLPGHLQTLRERLDPADQQQSLLRVGPGLRRRGAGHRHPRPAPAPLRSHRDQRPQLPAQKPPGSRRSRGRGRGRRMTGSPLCTFTRTQLCTPSSTPTSSRESSSGQANAGARAGSHAVTVLLAFPPGVVLVVGFIAIRVLLSIVH
jgi:hypothetical protein